MEKWLCWSAMGISGCMLVLFVLDLALGIPFGRLNLLVDILAAAASALVLYLSWDAFQDVK
jgi:hypothetical protein